MRAMRPGLLLLAAGQLVTGGWALVSPAGFYARFPGLRAGWVAADGPFNHHLVVDAGAGFAATGAALLLAAVWPRRHAVAVALGAYLVHAVPHLAYHARHPAPTLPVTDQVLSWAPLAAGAALAAWLLAASVRQPVRRSGPGPVPGSWRVLARVPRVARARTLADAAHETTEVVPERLAALALLRVAVLVGCEFCIDVGSAAAAGRGVGREQVRALAGWRDSDAYDEDERLALALADAMTATPAVVPDALIAELTARFGPAGVAELAAAIGHENARARANRALGVAPEGFAAAASCPLPGPVPSRPSPRPSGP